ncbi:hypothetical protein HDU92_004124 [Lobulomyces angularis]|nr:hypothetical protein HDU92_004124 [Lobulomyces angularis]
MVNQPSSNGGTKNVINRRGTMLPPMLSTFETKVNQNGNLGIVKFQLKTPGKEIRILFSVGLIKLKRLVNFTLTNSQQDLVESKFLGNKNKDVYTGFLSGKSKLYRATIDKKVLDKVEKEKKQKKKEMISKGEFIVERSPRITLINGTRPNRFETEKIKKELKKTEAKDFLLRKWQHMQGLRVSAISTIQAIKFYKDEFERLKNENARIQKNHAQIKEAVNKDISVRLEDNENMELKAAKLFENLIQQKKDQFNQFRIIENTCLNDQKVYLEELKVLEIEYQDMMEESSKLIIFKELSETDPESFQKVIEELNSKLVMMQAEEDKAIELLQFKNEQELKEIETKTLIKMAEIDEATGKVLQKKIKPSTPVSNAVFNNSILKKEIKLHKENHIKIDLEIENLEKAKLTLESNLKNFNEGNFGDVIVEKQCNGNNDESETGCKEESLNVINAGLSQLEKFTGPGKSKVGGRYLLGSGINDFRNLKEKNLKKFMNCQPEMEFKFEKVSSC